MLQWGASRSPDTVPPGAAEPQVDRGESEAGEDCRWGDLDPARAEHGDGYVCEFYGVNGGG